MADKYETLVDIFNASAKSFGPNPFIGTKKSGAWQWTSYKEFTELVDKARGGLAGLGLARGDRLAIISNNRVEWAVLAYACFGLGVAFVPMYEAQHEKDWEFIVKDCEAKALVVATDAILDKTKRFLTEIASLKNIVNFGGANGTESGAGILTYKALLESGKTAPAITPEKKDTACLIYTSGTTGNPKGVILSHNNIASNVAAIHECFPMAQGDRSLSFLPWAHSFGQTVELHGLFSMGASLAVCEAVDKIIDNLAEVQPTLLFSVPRIFNKLYGVVQKQISTKPGVVQSVVKAALRAKGKQRQGEHLGFGDGVILAFTDKLVFSKVRARFGGRLKYAFSGGAAISKEVAEFIDSLGVTVYEGYGLTETSPIATANWPGNRKIGSVGKAIPGVKIVIDPGDGTLTSKDGVEGEIVVYGPNVMQGYHNRKEENDAVFIRTTPGHGDSGFRTGDMGRLDKEGFLYITGRIKEQYKLENGKYVVPTPLEEQLKLSPLVANVMVYGDNRPFNVALVVANGDATKSFAAQNGIPGDVDALLKNDKVRARFAEEIKKYGEKFKGFEEVKDFALIDEDFTEKNGMLTPSLKMKRREVLKKWGDTINALYAKAKKPDKSAEAGASSS
jgi:long-chain acyl-CoA synthetase